MAVDDKILGVVNAVGLERDDQEFRNFVLTVGIKIKVDKKITYSEGEKLVKQLQKDLMGKNIELETVAVECPVCGKAFNSEQGMKQHLRLQHKEDEKPKRGRKKKEAEVVEEKPPAKKKPRKKAK